MMIEATDGLMRRVRVLTIIGGLLALVAQGGTCAPPGGDQVPGGSVALCAGSHWRWREGAVVCARAGGDHQAARRAAGPRLWRGAIECDRMDRRRGGAQYRLAPRSQVRPLP